jgi:signal transduction histidine kinase
MSELTHPSLIQGEFPYRLRQHGFVAELGKDALQGMELGQLFDKAVAGVADIFENEYCKVLELQPDGKHVFLRAGVGWQPGLVGIAMVDTGMDSQAGFTLASEHPVIVKDLRTEKRFNGPALLREHGVVSGMSVIIHGLSGPWGVMGTHTTRIYEFTEYDITFFQTIANVLASAIQRRKGEEELERRVAERTKELQLANDLKTQFVNTISHEVRTPMAGVIGLAEYLVKEPHAEDLQEVAQHLVSSSKRLLSILNDLLDFSRLEAGKSSVEVIEFSLKTLISDVVYLFKTEAERKGLEIKTSYDVALESMTVRSDEKKIAQILTNLISNAIKFSQDGSVEVDSSLVKLHDKTFLQIAVKDYGIGIAADSQQHLFKPFVQADGSMSRRYGGSGLGLSISQKYAELLGGQIGFETKEGSGSRFWFTVLLEDM